MLFFVIENEYQLICMNSIYCINIIISQTILEMRTIDNEKYSHLIMIMKINNK